MTLNLSVLSKLFDPQPAPANPPGLNPERKRQVIEEARQIEAPEKRFRAYVREAALSHAEHVLNVKAVDDVFKAHNLGERNLENN